VGKSLDKQPLLDKQRFFFDHYGVTENDWNTISQPLFQRVVIMPTLF